MKRDRIVCCGNSRSLSVMLIGSAFLGRVIGRISPARELGHLRRLLALECLELAPAVSVHGGLDDFDRRRAPSPASASR